MTKDAKVTSGSAETVRRARNIAGERERLGQGTATPERIVKAGEGFERHVGKQGAQRVVSGPLDRMYLSGKLTRTEYEAGDKFRVDAYLSAMHGNLPSIDWGRVGGGSDPAWRVPSVVTNISRIDASNRLHNAHRALHEPIWTILVDGCVHEDTLEDIGKNVFGRRSRDAAAAGDAGFKVALSALSAWYQYGG